MQEPGAGKKTLKSRVRDFGLPPRKSLGQVFLIERAVQEKILLLAEPRPDETVVEIGPGTGALTRALLPRVRKLIAVEIDPRLALYLRRSLESQESLILVCMDALHFDYRRAYGRLGGPMKIVGNLPYSVSSPLLFSFLAHGDILSLLVLMLQKEVALRLTAAPGTKSYGALTVLTRACFEVSLEERVSRHCFYPVPKVDSALVRLRPRPRERPVPKTQEGFFRTLVKAAFAKRRKTLFNSLRLSLEPRLPDAAILEAFRKCGVDPDQRAETLDLEAFAALAAAFHEVAEIHGQGFRIRP